ncbi:sigma-54 dependent transcriptional regulator [soil metagenome]
MKDTVAITTDELEPAVRLRSGFERAGFAVELLTSGETLSDAVGNVVLLVLSGGLRERRAQVLIQAARQRTSIPVLGLLEPDEIPTRALCRHLGVSECFAKPIDVDEVVLVGRRLTERERLREITGIVGETDVMEEVLERVVQIASVDTTVLIQGESGTGKELVARGIHALSPRRHRPFIAINVAALTDNLLESELFGHEKGAFTGASSLRKGLFELAHTGTIFLDEIGEMPLSTQTKLLRVLEEREFRRVGGEDVQRVDVRVITATNRNMREQVELGEFRRDLYHRLNILRIEIPPLRERKSDIPRLIDKFVQEFSRAHDRPFPGLHPRALEMLVEYSWPGNVRELRNLVESMVVLAPGGQVMPEDIPMEVRSRGRESRLPVLVRKTQQMEAPPSPAPEIEFVLRTIFDLRMDVDDLKRELDDLRHRHRNELPTSPAAGYGVLTHPAPVHVYDPRSAEEELDEGAEAEEQGVVVFRPGMTMEDLEREAIISALRQMKGNRRKTAETLGIGERTLYRKLKEYGVESS